MLIITGSLIISMSVASLVMIAINISRTQSDSVKAYFAADVGVERVLDFDQQETIDKRNCGTDMDYLCCNKEDYCLFFNQVVPGHEGDHEVSGCQPCGLVKPQNLGHEETLAQSYYIIYRGVSDDDSQVFLESTGISNGVKRSIKMTINRTSGCVPKCKDNQDGEEIIYECGYNQCNGFCGQCLDTEKCVDFMCVPK
ncbi:MAG TPA: hypothetical protein PKN62_01110 [bacterium]|nr:hypothetical protein [bacterium]